MRQSLLSRVWPVALAGAMLLIPTSAWALAAEQVAKLLPADGATVDQFGGRLSLDHNTVVIGATGGDDNGYWSGSAYVFTRTDSIWTEQAKLLPTDGVADDYFGQDVAIDGDTAFIGSPWDDDNGSASGSVYVFTRTDGVWTQEAKLLPADGAADDGFGQSVAIDGDTAIIASTYDDDNGSESGSAYVFTRTDGVWTEETKLLPNDGATGALFGSGIAIRGDAVIIGAVYDDDNGPLSGSAYVFTRTGGVWTQEAKLLPTDGEAEDRFGHYLALDGNTALIGAVGNDDSGSWSGSAYVFTRTGGVWTQEAKLLPADAATEDRFGRSVTVDGDLAVISSQNDQNNGQQTGSAYVFTRTGDIWTERAKLLADDGADGDVFGSGVTLDGDTVVIGAVRDDDNGTNSGSAYVFSLNSCSIRVTADAMDTLIWFVPESNVFDVASGYLSDLLADGDFSDAECLGTFSTSPAVDTLPGPSEGDARYYLARGLTSCRVERYGDSSMNPDPRDALDAGPCP